MEQAGREGGYGKRKQVLIKRKTEISTFVFPTDVIFYVYPQGNQQAKNIL